MKKSILFLGVVALVCSCSTPKATSYSYSEYQTITPAPSVHAIPVMAELEVSSERITYAERINKNIKTLTDAEVEALASREKETVIANAVKANNADVLVAPVVNITTDANNNLVIVVTGYPAVYKNFRTATAADSIFMKNVQPVVKQEKKTLNPLEIFKKK
jgi:hypothetical protein